jgi:hypothetical protein
MYIYTYCYSSISVHDFKSKLILKQYVIYRNRQVANMFKKATAKYKVCKHGGVSWFDVMVSCHFCQSYQE